MISVSNLAVERGSERVFEGVTFDGERGELLGVVGPNGAGKTSLLRAVNGTLDYEGRIELVGDDLADLSARETGQRVATVPQETALSFDFTVREVVAMGRHPHTPRFGTHDPDPVQRALERTDTAQFAERAASAVSGGERKRVLVARALAQDAPITLVDEPTGGLDVNHAVRTLELAADLAAEGRCVVAAIHDLSLAARYCDRIVLLADGDVVAAGEPESVLTAANLSRAFDANAAVSRDPVTDAPLVTALPAADPRRGGSVHVLGGGSAAVPYLHPLAAAGYDVSIGPVPEGDRDAEAARALGCAVETVPPFRAPDSKRVADALGGADVAVLAPVSDDGARALAPDPESLPPRTVVVGDSWPFPADVSADAPPERVLEAAADSGTPRPRAED